MGTRSFPQVKRTGHGINHPLRLKKEKSYISIPTLCLHSMSQSELSFSGMGQYFKIPVPLDFTLKNHFCIPWGKLCNCPIASLMYTQLCIKWIKFLLWNLTYICFSVHLLQTNSFTAELIIMTDITLHSTTVFFLWLIASWQHPVWSAITTILEEHVTAAFTYTLKMETADSMPLQNKGNHLTNCMLSAQETRFLIFTTAKTSPWLDNFCSPCHKRVIRSCTLSSKRVLNNETLQKLWITLKQK
jgi:hypothetical protein